MPRLAITIPFVTWREGRPRFKFGPAVRALGFKDRDLRHGRTGAWFTAEEALAAATTIVGEIEKARAKKAAGKRFRSEARAATRLPGETSIGELFEWFFKRPEMSGVAITIGKRKVKAKSANTVADYRSKADALAAFDGELWNEPVAALDAPIVRGLFDGLHEAKGLSMARGCIAVLSSAIGYGIRFGKVKQQHNPCSKLMLETPEPRLRALTPDEVRQLVAAADAIGLPWIGDSVTLGVWTGQRQADRLALTEVGIVKGRLHLKQQKTGALVDIPLKESLKARLVAMRTRRAALSVTSANIVMDEARGRPYARRAYNDDFRRALDTAVAGLKDAGSGAPILPPMASLADAHDQDLRDTAVTWLARAGCTNAEIAAITGHKPETITMILKHYLAPHAEIADNAMAKLEAWEARH